MTTWAVKDTDGSIALVTANEWEVDANGLAFLAGGRKVAWFSRWAAFWDTTTVLYLQEELAGQRI